MVLLKVFFTHAEYCIIIFKSGMKNPKEQMKTKKEKLDWRGITVIIFMVIVVVFLSSCGAEKLTTAPSSTTTTIAGPQ